MRKKEVYEKRKQEERKRQGKTIREERKHQRTIMKQKERKWEEKSNYEAGDQEVEV